MSYLQIGLIAYSISCACLMTYFMRHSMLFHMGQWPLVIGVALLSPVLMPFLVLWGLMHLAFKWAGASSMDVQDQAIIYGCTLLYILGQLSIVFIPVLPQRQPCSCDSTETASIK